MKTNNFLPMILLLAAMLFIAGRNVSANATGKDTLAVNVSTLSLPAVEEESYVNDIPFDTRSIALESLYMNLEKPEDEAYVDDIPFETNKIAANYSTGLMNIQAEEESYIDDIPFNTEKIAKKYLNSHPQLTVTDSKKNCRK